MPNQDPRTLDFQIDPYRGASLYQLLQGMTTTGEPIEVGYVYVTGSTRSDAIEHWLLYSSVDNGTGKANRQAYTWPTGSPTPTGLNFQFVSADPAFDPAAYKASLEKDGVTVAYIKATCSPGS
jgi:hypothetical protein